MVCLYSCNSIVDRLNLYVEAAREDLDELRKEFPPLTTGRVPIGDVFTSCNWVIRDGSAKYDIFLSLSY